MIAVVSDCWQTLDEERQFVCLPYIVAVIASVALLEVLEVAGCARRVAVWRRTAVAMVVERVGQVAGTEQRFCSRWAYREACTWHRTRHNCLLLLLPLRYQTTIVRRFAEPAVEPAFDAAFESMPEAADSDVVPVEDY